MKDFDPKPLATELRSVLEERGLSLRAAAKQIGCSPSTLCRMLGAVGVPDGDNLVRLSRWLGRPIAELNAPGPGATTIGDVERQIRALPGLAAPEIEGLVALVRAFVREARKVRTRIEPVRVDHSAIEEMQAIVDEGLRR